MSRRALHRCVYESDSIEGKRKKKKRNENGILAFRLLPLMKDASIYTTKPSASSVGQFFC